jgi:GxxExxY protein
MEADGLGFQRECNMIIYYLETQIGERRVDFFVENKICVEIKAITKLENVHFAQARNYLEAFNVEIGLLINFGAISPEYRRIENPKFNPSIINHTSNTVLSQKSL